VVFAATVVVVAIGIATVITATVVGLISIGAAEFGPATASRPRVCPAVV